VRGPTGEKIDRIVHHAAAAHPFIRLSSPQSIDCDVSYKKLHICIMGGKIEETRDGPVTRRTTQSHFREIGNKSKLFSQALKVKLLSDAETFHSISQIVIFPD
jgi:hypothetical protein